MRKKFTQIDDFYETFWEIGQILGGRYFVEMISFNSLQNTMKWTLLFPLFRLEKWDPGTHLSKVQEPALETDLFFPQAMVLINLGRCLSCFLPFLLYSHLFSTTWRVSSLFLYYVGDWGRQQGIEQRPCFQLLHELILHLITVLCMHLTFVKCF